MNIRVFNKILFGLTLFGLFVVPASTHAASIYFAPSSGNYTVGEQFSINVFVSSGTEEMNAVKATVVPSNNNVQLISVSQSGSIIDFWARGPQVNGDGDANFEGVMLGKGYYGSAGKLVTLVFRARFVGNTTLVISSGSVLANDGFGTELPTDLGKANFSISAVKITPTIEIVPEDFIFTKDLRQRDSGNEVTRLQMCLRDQGFFTGDIIDYFGVLTKQAVIDFQEAYRDDVLAPGGFSRGTGQVGELTRKKLNEVCFVTQVVEDIEQPYATTTPVPAPIEITEEEKDAFYINIWFWVGTAAVLAMVIILLLIIIIVLLLRRAPVHFKRKHKQVLAKEETALRKASKHLLTNKKKIERELQKVEDKLKKFSREDDS